MSSWIANSVAFHLLSTFSAKHHDDHSGEYAGIISLLYPLHSFCCILHSTHSTNGCFSLCHPWSIMFKMTYNIFSDSYSATQALENWIIRAKQITMSVHRISNLTASYNIKTSIQSKLCQLDIRCMNSLIDYQKIKP